MTPSGADHEYILAFDFGLKHIGVCVGQTVTNTASPLTTLRANNGKPDWPTVQALLAQWNPARLIVGLPLNMDSSESEMSERARAFAQQLGIRTGRPVELVDERLTTREAKTLEPQRSHEVAAVLIAETWLEQAGR